MTDLVPVGTTIDLSNCEREPIRVPGTIQPHGVLLTVSGPNSPVAQVSGNCADLLGRGPEQVLGATLSTLFTAESSRVIKAVLHDPDSAGTPFRVRAAISPTAAELDCLVHRSGGFWIVELEPQTGDVELANTYHEVRTAVSALNRATSNAELYELAVRQIRQLTGFDRVMLYRFDRDWNGEVHAEAKLDSLESFRGLHYPASDIPAQARELYTVNWLRFIRDVNAVNAPLIPPRQPLTDDHLDLSFAALRSVSPIHCEYLRNMGVRASMSVSIVIGGQLAGLIACHHYSGPYVPAPSVRATCEFLAQTLSLLVGSREQQERTARAGAVGVALNAVIRGTSHHDVPVAESLAQQAIPLLHMVAATGVAWTLDGVTRTAGAVPDEADLQRLRSWVTAVSPTSPGLVGIQSLGQDNPDFLELRDVASGLLLLRISPDQDLLFFRPEVTQTVDWGGNPHLKELTVGSNGVPRLSPRGSFALWRETVEGRCLPWEDVEMTSAGALRDHLVLQLFREARGLLDTAETLQRSLLPERLPDVAGFDLAAEYRPASAGVGGDWYDAIELPDGALLLVVGDVAGHGLSAAGTMGQLRNALRAYAVEDATPAVILRRLNHLALSLMEASMATAVIARLEPETGRLTIALAGHPPVLIRRQDRTCRAVEVEPRPPLGADFLETAGLDGQVDLELDRGEALLMYSDGVFERRDEAIDASLRRWIAFAANEAVAPAGDVVRTLLDAARPEDSEDDATLLLLQRLL